MNNILIKIYWVIFGLLNLGTAYQLINPNVPRLPNSSGLGILQPLYTLFLYGYILYSTIYGIYMAYSCYKYKYSFLKYLISICFILTIPIFLFGVERLSSFLNRYNYFINLKVLNPVWSWIILGHIFFITQATLLYFFNEVNILKPLSKSK